MNKVKTEGLKYSNDVKPPVVLRVPDDSPGRGSHMDTGSLLATSGSAAHQKPSQVCLNTTAGRSGAITHPSSSPSQRNKGDIFPSSALFYIFFLLLPSSCFCYFHVSVGHQETRGDLAQATTFQHKQAASGSRLVSLI